MFVSEDEGKGIFCGGSGISIEYSVYSFKEEEDSEMESLYDLLSNSIILKSLPKPNNDSSSSKLKNE